MGLFDESTASTNEQIQSDEGKTQKRIGVAGKRKRRQEKRRKPLLGRSEAPRAAIVEEEAKEEEVEEGVKEEEEEEPTKSTDLDGSKEPPDSDRDNIRLLQRIARGTRELAVAIAASQQQQQQQQQFQHRTRPHHLKAESPFGSSPSLSLQAPKVIGDGDEEGERRVGEEVEKQGDKRDEDPTIGASGNGAKVRLRPEKWLEKESNQASVNEIHRLSSWPKAPIEQENCLIGPNAKPVVGIPLDDCQRLANKIEFEEAEEATRAIADNRLSGPEASLPLICGQLLTLVCGLIVLLYLVELANRSMTNLFSKILGGVERRRSLATPNQAQTDQANLQSIHSGGIMQSHSSSTLSLPRNAGPLIDNSPTSAARGQSSASCSGSGQSRRSSRSSIHSVSAMLISALTGGRASNNNNNNGRSIIAKNKEDTVIIASPTIIQKESTDSAVSTPGAIGSPAPPVASPVSVQQQHQHHQDTVTTSAPASTLEQQQQQQHQGAPASAAAAAKEANNKQQASTANTTVNYQSQYNLSTDRAHPLAAYLSAAALVRPDHTVAVAAAAAAADSSPSSSSSSNRQQLPTLATQIPATVGAASSSLEQVSAATSVSAASAGSSHAPLNSSSTIRLANSNSTGSPKKTNAADTTTTNTAATTTTTASTSQVAARQGEIIRATELLLNALNQGDYETFTHLCDPHMTSFEPENMGNLIDNMEYRRLLLDQARQLQLQHHLKQDPRASAVAAATTTTTLRQYSIILNPSVYLLGEDAASIAYTKLSQLMNMSNGGQLISVEKSEETRIWHRKNGTKWLCVHLHRSIVDTKSTCCSTAQMLGPQTSASLIRCQANQRELEAIMASSNQAPTGAAGAAAAAAAAAATVPLISLNK